MDDMIVLFLKRELFANCLAIGRGESDEKHGLRLANICRAMPDVGRDGHRIAFTSCAFFPSAQVCSMRPCMTTRISEQLG